MNLSSGRERRSNAGNRMAAMIQQEQAKIASGDLSSSDEEQDQTIDAEALDQLQEVEGDQVDSDFAETDSETERADQQAADEEQREPERRRRRRNNNSKVIVPRFAKRRQPKKPHIKKPSQTKPSGPTESLRASSRTSAMQKAEETRAILSEREVLADLKKHTRKRPRQRAHLTQEQLLEEAKQTERENLRRLRDFQHQEAVQQRRRQRETASRGPLMIPPVAHWKSTTQQTGNSRRIKTVYRVEELDRGCVAVVPPRVCAVTGLPARYMHPRARVPFADVRAYGVLEKLVQGEYAYYGDLGAWNDS